MMPSSVWLAVVLVACGVFKAHRPRDETKNAEEIKDSEETVHDIPVDLQEAATVEVKCCSSSN